MTDDNGRVNGVVDVVKAKPANPDAVFREIGSSGLDTSGGLVFDRDKPLSTVEQIRLYKEMRDTDPVLGAIRFAIDMLLRQVEWTVTPADVETIRKDVQDDAVTSSSLLSQQEAERAADHINSCLGDLNQSWEDVCTSITTFLDFGWSFNELVYKRRLGENPSLHPAVKQLRGEVNKSSDLPAFDRGATSLPASKFDDGLIGWRKVALRSQDTLARWRFDDDGGIAGMYQIAPPTYEEVFIPIGKALLFRTTSAKNSPEGRSIYVNARRPYKFKLRIENIEGVGIERDLAGYPKGYAPYEWLIPDASPEQKAMADKLFDLITNIKRDKSEGVLLPSLFDEAGNRLVDIELMSTQGRRQFDTDQIIGRYDQRLAMTTLADFILLGHEKVGSYALGGSKMNMFQMALNAWLDSICDIFNTHGIPRLVRINGWPAAMSPQLGHSPIAEVDLDALSGYVKNLAAAGFMWGDDPEVDNYFRRAADVPEREGTEAL